jgi:hypothetical protein
MLHQFEVLICNVLAEIMKEQPTEKIYVACCRFGYVFPKYLAHDDRFGSALIVYVMLATFGIC